MKPADDERDPPPRAQAGSNTVNVRGFRLLISLTLPNATLLGGFVLGPQFLPCVKEQWAVYQQRKADEAAAAAEAAKEQQQQANEAARRREYVAAQAAALAYAPPTDTLLYDDDPPRGRVGRPEGLVEPET